MAASQNGEETTLGQYAGFVTRLVAYLIDGAIVTGLVTLVSIIASYVGGFLGINRLLGTGQSAALIVLILALSVSILITASYNILFWMFAGQTPGKRLMGVRVVMTDGTRVRFWRAVARWLGYVVSSILFLGFLWIFVDNRRQGFHDKIAGTIVVYSWPEGEQLGTFVRDQALRFQQLRNRPQKGAS